MAGVADCSLLEMGQQTWASAVKVLVVGWVEHPASVPSVASGKLQTKNTAAQE